MSTRIDYQMPAGDLTMQNNLILATSAAGVPSRQAAKLIGNLSYRTVCRRLKQLTPRNVTEIYKTMRADIFAEQQRKLLMQCHGKPAKEVQSLVTSVAILYDKERLERDLSTSNTALIHEDIAALRGK